MKERNASVLKGSLIFAGGLLLGAGTALLLAPQSGARTRRQLRRCVEDFQDDLNECLGDLVQECRTAGEKGLDKGKATSRKLQQDAVQALNAGREQISRRIEQLRHALSA